MDGDSGAAGDDASLLSSIRIKNIILVINPFETASSSPNGQWMSLLLDFVLPDDNGGYEPEDLGKEIVHETYAGVKFLSLLYCPQPLLIPV
ncbi:unnamed protein product [Allacma fusca]|uniref:Uncharacterized protein n=1 Tax=Allacma fusca TaxID=39272 RepID=A0A8J2L9D3_9HEXA|nr:unnamed protein product [Allacma fusca]